MLRYLDGHWIAIDNQSLNGIFVDGGVGCTRWTFFDGAAINVGNPEGPRLTFALTSPAGPPPDDRPTTPTNHVGTERKTEVLSIATAVCAGRATGQPRSTAPSGARTTVGRALDNDIVIPDVLASEYHAYLVPTAQGVQIVDVSRHQRHVRQRPTGRGTQSSGEGDVVTIGNLDLVHKRQGRRCARQPSLTAAGGRASGLEVRGISLTVDANRTLLDRISFSAKPASLTAVIGPSGSGKSTLAKVIVGGTRPNSGTVSFEGHDVHAEYASMRSRVGLVPQDDVVHRLLTVFRSTGLRSGTADAAGQHEARSATRDRAGARGTRVDASRADSRGQVVGWTAQAGIGGAGTVDRTVAARSSTSPRPGLTPRSTAR